MAQKCILRWETFNFFSLDQNFDNVTCCIPSFDFRAPSAQACIISALSATVQLSTLQRVRKLYSMSVSRFRYDTFEGYVIKAYSLHPWGLQIQTSSVTCQVSRVSSVVSSIEY